MAVFILFNSKGVETVGQSIPEALDCLTLTTGDSPRHDIAYNSYIQIRA